MDRHTVAHGALVGWRGRVAERLATSLERRVGVDAETVRVVVGLAFLGLSLWYVASTAVRVARRSG